MNQQLNLQLEPPILCYWLAIQKSTHIDVNRLVCLRCMPSTLCKRNGPQCYASQCAGCISANTKHTLNIFCTLIQKSVFIAWVQSFVANLPKCKRKVTDILPSVWWYLFGCLLWSHRFVSPPCFLLPCSFCPGLLEFPHLLLSLYEEPCTRWGWCV